jgi:hypothetical protein
MIGNPEHPPSPNGDSERDQRGRFAKGNSGGPGNPLARQASKFRAAAMSAITPEHVAAIIRKATKKALEGDMKAARLVLERVLGRPGEEMQEIGALAIELPDLNTASDCLRATKVVLDAIVDGSITRETASLLIDAINARTRAIETVEIEQRMRELEQRLEARTGKPKGRTR